MVFDRVVMSVDAAFKDGKRNDYVAISVWGKKKNQIYLLDLVNDTDEDVLISLKNGSIGARTNLLRYKYQTNSGEFIRIKGDEVTVKNTVIGKMNSKVAMGISSVMEKDGDITVRGDLNLPWFTSEPLIYCGTGALNRAQLQLTRESSRFTDMMGEEFYNSYSFEVALKAKEEMRLQMYLKTKDGRLYLQPNLRNEFQKNVKVKRDGDVLILKTHAKSLSKRVKNKIVRIKKKIVK